MFKLTIDKVIGEDWWQKYTGVSEEISSAYVRDTLAAFPDNENELRIVINSPGGDVFEGITIFNIIREFARDNPKVKIKFSPSLHISSILPSSNTHSDKFRLSNGSHWVLFPLS